MGADVLVNGEIVSVNSVVGSGVDDGLVEVAIGEAEVLMGWITGGV
jgi:hypothetical protein